ncbi:BAI1-associated protein 3 [Thrips palmi]|uniref:BAI1-associated protein 3 n=1 Tax=Thrips palmi TaxID=161013 RepID=A0A6P8ZW73_THRPL|nr:BAI1-associated protein 3 [Thrips palmi]
MVARESQERPGAGLWDPNLERGLGPPPPPGVWWPPDPDLRDHREAYANEQEDLYVEVLYTLANRVGSLGSHGLGHSLGHGLGVAPPKQVHQSQLHDYVRAAFGFTPEQHRRLLAVAREEKPPIVVLNVVVLEAEGLEAKDANGFSDPYCMLGIQPTAVPPAASAPSSTGLTVGSSHSTPASPQQSTESDEGPPHPEKLRKHHSFRLSFKRREGRDRPHRDSMSAAVPAKFIRATSVKPATLNPRWNEKFRFDIDDVNSDILHLDIWDHDDESSVLDAVSRLNEVRGVKGLGRFFKQIAQSARSGSTDDFLGCVNIPVADIPSQGAESWFNLEARTHRSNVQGRIRLKMWLSTREDRGTSEEDNWQDLRQQERLHEVFIAHELHEYHHNRTWEWRGELGANALAVLHQHAIQGDVTDLQLAIVRFAAYARVAVVTPLDHAIIVKLMHDLEEQWDSGPLSREEEDALAEAFNLWTEHALLLVRRHRLLYPPRCRELCGRLEMLLRTVSALGHTRAMAKCCPFNKDLRAELGCALRKAATDWYDELVDPVRDTLNLDDRLHALLLAVNKLLVGLQASRSAYDNMFVSVMHVPYFCITFKQIEKLVHADLCALTCSVLGQLRCAELGDEPGPVQLCTNVFELYLALQDVSAMAEYTERSERGSVERAPTTLTTFYTWFEAALHRWLDLAHFKMSNRIRRAVEMNTLCTAELIVRHTTSAMDVSACFYHINEFWKLLNWPDLVSSYNIVHKIIQTISTAALFYADLTHQKLKDQGFYEDKGPYRTTDDMCAAINDLEYVRRALNHVPRDLHVDSILEAVEAAEMAAAARQNSGAWKEDMYAALEQAATQMEQYTLLIIAQIGAKMRPSLKKAMFHLAWSPDSLPTVDAISPLLQYLDCHLQSLNAALLPKNFERALCEVWEVVLLELGHQMDGSSGDKLPGFYDRLHEALGLLLSFFHADTQGLNLEALRSGTYFKVDQRLQYHRTDTERLVDLYHQQRLLAQLGCESAEYGVLAVRAYFNHDSLCVEVLSARDVIPLDPNGFSDPFVIVELLPRRLFAHCLEQTTHVHKKTLNPVFDECFEFSVTLEQCRSEGAMILFTVMDHDVLTANDFAGEAFLALSSVPGVADTNSSIDNFHGLKHAELPLMHQKNRNHPILEVLETRVHDRVALDFVKKQKQRLATT